MPSAVYLHDGENQITVTFRTEQDRERFKAHYRAIDAAAVRFRDERDTARERTTQLEEALRTIADLTGNELLTWEVAVKEIAERVRAALASRGGDAGEGT